MKILMINSVCGIRSTGRICTDLALALENAGHEVKIAYGRETVAEQFQKYAVRIGNDVDVKIHGLKSRLLDCSGFCSTRATKTFINWINEYNPDVIHLHNLHGYYINIEELFEYLKVCRKKILWTLHDCWAFTGHCSYFDYANCQKWKNECFHCPQKTRYPKSIFVDNSIRNYKLKKQLFTGINNLVIVTPSQWLADHVKCSFLSEYEVQVIHNGIDTDVFTYRKSDIKKKLHCENKKIILGVAAVWNKRKGIDTFYELASRLNDSYQIVLVGLDDKQIKDLPGNIIGIKRTDSAVELAELYSAADVFVNPTLEDNYPTTNLESQQCGTPVITYKTGGSIESVPYDNVVEQGEIQGIIKKIKTDLKIGELDFGKGRMVKEYLELCHHI